ncbi:hypothetical protein NDU88_003344 [Pleurodeles waltl]|uniref:Uncharacterized protein n=1 Tax=Pleurodeles waltl TaxID=8319 RepID=A0AAV7UFY4_PLEWA|nr:hypothetical protein NDU88_003344 [Pleurodeles waltl]
MRAGRAKEQSATWERCNPRGMQITIEGRSEILTTMVWCAILESHLFRLRGECTGFCGEEINWLVPGG